MKSSQGCFYMKLKLSDHSYWNLKKTELLLTQITNYNLSWKTYTSSFIHQTFIVATKKFTASEQVFQKAPQCSVTIIWRSGAEVTKKVQGQSLAGICVRSLQKQSAFHKWYLWEQYKQSTGCLSPDYQIKYQLGFRVSRNSHFFPPITFYTGTSYITFKICWFFVVAVIMCSRNLLDWSPEITWYLSMQKNTSVK